MKKKISENKFLTGALILSAGGLVSKIIGALYRIPLTNILGARGMGIYQLVFPMYALLLTVGSAGLNIAVSRLVAEKYAKDDAAGAKNILYSALKILGILGISGGLILFFFGEIIARVQGEPAAAAAYRAIAPAVALVCIIAALRGYFQGRQKMAPTAVSQIIEQVIKMIVSLWAASLFMPDVTAAATGAVLAVTLSEAAALLYLFAVYLFDKRKNKTANESAPPQKITKQLLLLAVPITLSGIILPLTQLIDSALVLNILGRYTKDATTLFGLLSGPVNSLISLPVAVTLGFATAAVPAISKLRVEGNRDGAAKKSSEAVKLTLLFSVPAAVVMFFAAGPVIGFLYRALPAGEKAIAVNLLKLSSVNIIFLSLLSTATSILHAMGRIYAPVRNLGFAAALKIVLNLILLSRPEINIFGAAVSTAACYILATVLDLLSLKKGFQNIKSKQNYDIIKA